MTISSEERSFKWADARVSSRYLKEVCWFILCVLMYQRTIQYPLWLCHLLLFDMNKVFIIDLIRQTLVVVDFSLCTLVCQHFVICLTSTDTVMHLKGFLSAFLTLSFLSLFFLSHLMMESIFSIITICYSDGFFLLLLLL